MIFLIFLLDRIVISIPNQLPLLLMFLFDSIVICIPNYLLLLLMLLYPQLHYFTFDTFDIFILEVNNASLKELTGIQDPRCL